MVDTIQQANELMGSFLDMDTLLGLAIEDPRVHGNGFIQLDLGENYRVNFWGHKDIPKQEVDTGIHDHAYDFISCILKGSIFNTRYEKEIGKTHKVYVPQVAEGHDTKLIDTKTTTAIRESQVEHICFDDIPDCLTTKSYYMLAGELHKTEAFEPAVTLMKKIPKPKFIQKHSASVLVKWGERPDNQFDRHAFNHDDTWALIETIIKHEGLKVLL